ncbi:hypothetical protein TNCV_1484241 [Trichonephila clavipes]|nr:hypothetical protein TNCV_1484241 [Trichonephila clavipes]
MQVSSEPQNNYLPPQNEQSYTTEMVSFNDVLLVVMGTFTLHMKEGPARIGLQAHLDLSEIITQVHCCGVHNTPG